ncbi:MAG: hotdog domain-containing protein [Acidimicrobiia bacterium]|nr:hotdog domain-containing protein [Acidimicrobiia bacterium]
MELAPGLTGTAALTVGDADLAPALGSGDVPVLGTPRVVALSEEATVDAVADALDTGSTTVGVRVDVEHLAPSIAGSEVVATAVVTEVDGRRLTYTVTVRDGDRIVARGTIWRVAVDRDRFVDGLGD